MRYSLPGLVLTSLALFGFIEGGVIRYQNTGQSSDGSKLWVANFVKTANIFFKDPDNSPVSKIISTNVIQHSQGDDKCRNSCIINQDCRSYNIAKLSATEFYCELTKYHYKESDMKREKQEGEGKDCWSIEEQ